MRPPGQEDRTAAKIRGAPPGRQPPLGGAGRIMAVTNQFRVLIIMALVVSIAFVAGFVYMVFAKNPGHVSRSSEATSLSVFA